MPLSLMASVPAAGVEFDPDPELRVILEVLRMRDGLEAQLVGGIRGIGDQLPEKDLAVAVERMDHQVKQLLHLGLEAVGFPCRHLASVSISARAGH